MVESRRVFYIQSVLDGIVIPALLVDRNHRILLQNKAAKELFGSKEGGLCWQELFKGETLPPNQKTLYQKGQMDNK